MTDLIEVLNQTSAIRTVFYCVIFVIVVGIVAEAVSDILVAAFNRNKKS